MSKVILFLLFGCVVLFTFMIYPKVIISALCLWVAYMLYGALHSLLNWRNN